jgi:tetratricopeptide (TPR) repeat protein
MNQKNQECWMAGGADDFSSITGIDVKSANWPSPPAYHTSVTDSRAAVRAVRIPESLDTEELVDAWLSCCLNGSPSLLCFFVDTQGIFRGCRFVAVSDIPNLSRLAMDFHPGRRCLSHCPAVVPDAESKEEVGMEAFDPRALREMSHTLLETLIDRIDHDGGQCLVMANPLGIHFLNASLHSQSGEDSDSGEDRAGTLMLKDAPELIPGFERKTPSPSKAADSPPRDSHAPHLDSEQPSVEERLHRAYMTQALLLYHAAVRLASARLPQGSVPDGVKDVPVGSRWTAKSCRHPLRVRQMMLRAVRALRAAIAIRESNIRKSNGDKETPIDVQACSTPHFRRRFLLLLASAFEFLADTFLAEDSPSTQDLDINRQLSALRHLDKSTAALSQYIEHAEVGEKVFAQSVQRLEERVLAKQANIHLCLARLHQRRLWSEHMPRFRTTGKALRELDIAERLVLSPPRVVQQPRPPGPHESSLLASIAKWKADLLFEFVSLVAPSTIAGTDVDASTKEYLESQTDDLGEPLQALPLQTERWLQSIVSLSLRSLHHLASVPTEIVGELQAQARELLARAYRDMGHIYASTGRYTKAMTHAKQGIELFNATHDKCHAAALQLWLCRLQLRLAVPQASTTGGSILDESALFRGLSAVSSAEDSACAQVVTSLQRVLKSLESKEAVERSIQVQIQTLLGRVVLRQGLSRMARAAPFCAVSGLCEGDSALLSVLELVQGGEPVSMDGVKEAVELLLQASSYFRDANQQKLNGVAHACLAGSYFRGRLDARVQRLALTHCHHALEHLHNDAGGGNGDDNSLLELAVQLLEAKTLRKAGTKGSSSSSRVGDASAAVGLCNIALRCLQLGRSSNFAREGKAEQRPSDDICESECSAEGDMAGQHRLVPRTVLASAEQCLPFESYVRQELTDLLLRLLKGNERQEASKRDLKGLYGALLTAWHTDAGQTQALTALRDYMENIDAADG